MPQSRGTIRRSPNPIRRRSPSPVRVEYVINPHTGRRIRKGGPYYRSLVSEGKL